ncbi:hypothetical protein ACFVAE_16815 [Microbacterium sp. NPDC057659]|uniref:hypothetical protein n=1 Tax=Microbacterium sp. NPDC057659 TaxID=3346198 RepID=UPI00366D26CF
MAQNPQQLKPWYRTWWTVPVFGAVVLVVIVALAQAFGPKPEPVVRPTATSTASDSATALTETASGLTYSEATTACNDAAQAEVDPDTWNGSPKLDPLESRIVGDAWYVKFGGTVTSAAGAEVESIVECTVGGAPDAAVVKKVKIER